MQYNLTAGKLLWNAFAAWGLREIRNRKTLGRSRISDEDHNLRAVVFDLDGTIVNSEDVYEQVDVEVLRRRGQDFAPALREHMIGRPAVDSVRIMIDHHGLDETVEDIDAERTILFDRMIIETVQTMPGFLPLLDAL